MYVKFLYYLDNMLYVFNCYMHTVTKQACFVLSYNLIYITGVFEGFGCLSFHVLLD